MLTTTLAALALSQPLTHTLDNGARITIVEVPGIRAVAVEACYEAGFFDDPPGMPQAAHLIEHIACRGATAIHEPLETWTALNREGMHNAETLGDFTHFDYAASAEELDRILSIEAARLCSLVIDDAIMGAEIPRCAAELTNIERLDGAPVGKFALMAARQAWAFGADAVSLKHPAIDADTLRTAHARLYRPDMLHLVIVGDVRADEAMDLARHHLAAIEAPDAAPPAPPTDWQAAARVREVRWDSTRPVAVIASPPPEDAFDRAVLSLAGEALSQAMIFQPPQGFLTQSILASRRFYPVGDLPFFVLAVPMGDAGPDRLLEAVRMRTGPDRLAPLAAMIRAGAASMLAPPRVSERDIRITAASIARVRSLPADDPNALALACTNAALQIAMLDHARAVLGDDAIRRASRAGDDEIARVLDKALADERAIRLMLVPDSQVP